VLTFEQITELVKLVADRQLQGVEIERSGFRLKVEGQRPAQTVLAAAVEAPAPPVAVAAEAPPSTAAAAVAVTKREADSDGLGDAHILISPIVGTFYRAPAPDAETYAEVGQRVSKGQILCIVEAMKLMNEIESDADGVIEKIFPKNAQPVEYGEPLFAIRAD